jgi:hypothetical protein
MKKKLTDAVKGGIYEYVDNKGKVVYRGSTEHDTLEKVDWYHREGHGITKYKYSMTVFRSNLRRPIAQNQEWTIRWKVEPKEMTREQLLNLEGELIREAIDLGECMMNHTPDPLASWKKYNG